MHVN